jgi:dihydroneopterin aldolase
MVYNLKHKDDLQKKIMQKVLIDLEITIFENSLKEKNNLLELLDYSVVTTKIKNYFEGSQIDLIEDLIIQIWNVIKNLSTTIERVLIKVFKFKTDDFISHVAIEKEFKT